MKHKGTNRDASGCGTVAVARSAWLGLRRTAGVVLLTLAAGGATATQASASKPEWGTCRPAAADATHRYSDPGCTERTNSRTDGYEWEPLQPGGPVLLVQPHLTATFRFQTRAGKTIECSALGPESEARPDTPTRALTPLWELRGCESEGMECETTRGAVLGEINDAFQWMEEPAEPSQPRPGWKGRLAWVSKSHDEVGIEYLAANHERLFNTIACRGPLGIFWIGGDGKKRTSIVAALTPVNTMTDEIAETYSSTEPGVPAPERLEHRPFASALAFAEGHWEPVAISAGFHYRVESGLGQLEIRATG